MGVVQSRLIERAKPMRSFQERQQGMTTVASPLSARAHAFS